MSNDKKIIIFGLIITIISIFGIAILLTPNKSDLKVSEDGIIASSGLHWHPTLEIFINGEKQEIPENIGILPTKHEEIHTHDDASKGIIHMEMEGIVTQDETKLGRFFEIWGKEFNASGIFDMRNSTQSSVKMFVDDKENKEFDDYLMKDGVKIVIRYE